MAHRFSWRTPLAAALLLLALAIPSDACCPAPPSGELVLNADQTVILLWDPIAKRQHFIRQASFDSAAADFGFIIPSPSKPELEESGAAAFEMLKRITAPKIIYQPRSNGGCNIGCSSDAPSAAADAVRLLEEKQVAGFDAVVLEADSSDELVNWLSAHGYAFSPQVADWAQPYIEQKWKFTALKVAKPAADAVSATVAAGPLRMSFDTERPLFPYREPDYAQIAKQSADLQQQLAQKQRLLRVYFLSDARYDGRLGDDHAWTGRVAWSGKLADHDRQQLLTNLKLPAETGPQNLHLTEFEDDWKYEVAPADLYFAPSLTQENVVRPPVYVSTRSGGDALLAILVVALISPLLVRRRR